MKYKIILILLIFNFLNLSSKDAILQYDNGIPKGNYFQNNRNGWEESMVLQPNGPCKIKKIQIYYSGKNKSIDTLHFVGFPTAGNLYPTEYIWSYNSLTEPIIFNYDGVEGWKEIDISNINLKSDGFDKIVIQHKMNPQGPYFTFDDNGTSTLCWITDPYTENANFYNIMGTLHYLTQGDFLIRFILEYKYPLDSLSQSPPSPKFISTNLISGGGYPSIADINNDGFDDIILGGTIFQNNKNNSFTNISIQNPINASGTTWGDINNDGFIDCYAIANGTADFDKRLEWNNNRIYKNNGKNIIPSDQKSIFLTPYPSTKVNFQTNIDYNNDSIHNPYNAISPVFFDYNNDGKLDLFIANRRTEISGKPEMFSPDELWEGISNGFKNVSISSNIRNGEKYTAFDGVNGFGYFDCYGAQSIDYNKDNKQDLFVANYRLIKDNLFKNNGNSTFNEVAAQTAVQGVATAATGYFGHGMGCQWGDFNNDSYPDLIVGNLAHTDYRGIYSNPSLIFKNSGPPNYTFSEVHNQMGLKFHEGNAGSLWLDLDLDGNLDLWHGKYSGGIGSFYFNQGAPDYKLVEKTWELNCKVDNPWVAVKTDFDNDGDFDLVMNGVLYRNDIIHKGKFIGIRLVGSPKDSVSMDAYGTKVTIQAGGKTFYQELSGSSSGTLCSQNSNELLFGLGDVSKIDDITIDYPNGKKLKLNKIPEVNGKYVIKYDGTIDQKIIATPSQIWPENNQILDNDTVRFRWNRVAGAKQYRTELLNKLSNQVVGEAECNDTIQSIIFKINPNIVYLWRVKAIGDSLVSNYSSNWQFCYKKPNPISLSKIYPPKDTMNISVLTKFKWNIPNFDFYLRDDSILYKLNIYDSTKQKVIFTIENLKDNNFKLADKLQPNTKYFWSVSSKLTDGEYKEFELWAFKTMPLPIKLDLIEPFDKSINQTTKPQFKWNSDNTCLFYQLETSLDSNFTVIDMLKDSLSYSNYKLFKSLNGQTKYYWRVRGINDGGYGKWSDTWSFTTAGVNSVNNNDNENSLFVFQDIFPQPANDKINFSISSLITSNTTILLLNNIGITIKKNEIMLKEGQNKFEFDLKDLPSGMYYIQLDFRDQRFSKPFLKIN